MLKAEAISDGRKATAGTVLGVGGKTSSGEVLLMADKIAYVDPRDRSVTPAFVAVVENGRTKQALNGGLVTNGTILGRRIAAAQTFRAPVIDGGSLNIDNDRFVVNSKGQVSVSALSGNVGMKITNDNTNVYDENGMLQAWFGLLTDW